VGYLDKSLKGRMRSVILEVALVGLAAGTVSGQTPTTYGELGVPRGGVRLKYVEDSLPPPAPGDTRFVRAYRFNTTSEMMFGVFKGSLGGTRDLDVEQDSATLEPGETTPVSYRLDFHVFDDVCRDAGTAAGGASGTACKSWLRGIDKRKAFTRSGRIPYPNNSEDVWVDHGRFVWLVRNPDGAWVHWEVLVADDGLSKDWKQHSPYSRIVVQQIVHSKPAPTAQQPPAAPAPPAAVAPAHEPDLVPGPKGEPAPAAQAPAITPPAHDPDLVPAPTQQPAPAPVQAPPPAHDSTAGQVQPSSP